MSGKAPKSPFLRLYPGEELQAPVSGCSMGAQGLWLRLRMIMHSSEPYGYLCPVKVPASSNGTSAGHVEGQTGDIDRTDKAQAAAILSGHLQDIGGTCPSDALVARRCGIPLDEYRVLKNELDEAGVPNYTVSGIMYCEELLRQASARAEWRSRKAKQRDLPFNGEAYVPRESREGHATVPPNSAGSSYFILNKKGRSNGKQSETERREENNRRAVESAATRARDR
jgi:hypothetical protein